MSKKTIAGKTETAGKSRSKKSAEESSSKPKGDGFRETVDSIVVAFILAFMFRAFLAEAFVIPTGSMAPTLFGRHKQITCKECGFTYAVGASDEVDDTATYLYPENRMHTAICPNCRYEMPAEIVKNAPVFTGDRILVNKFPYEFGNPKRWDVVVFKYPEEPSKNYIKRLVGLPNETISLRQGDVYVLSENGPRMVRKNNPKKQNELQVLVHNENFPPRALHDAGWPQSWAAVVKVDAPESVDGWSQTSEGWQQDLDKRTFSLKASDDEKWIRYRHYVPNRADWKRIQDGKKFSNVRPQLVTDFCGYNAYTPKPVRLDLRDMESEKAYIDPGYYWVGDLTISCQVNVESSQADSILLIELNEGLRRYRCEIDISTGQAILKINVPENREEEWRELATAKTDLSSTGQYSLKFANVDNRLTLWVDGEYIDFGRDDSGVEKSIYRSQGGDHGWQEPVNADLTPVGISAKGADLVVSDLILTRDIYYRNEILHPAYEHNSDEEGTQSISEYGDDIDHNKRLTDLVHSPQKWFAEYQSYLSVNIPQHLNENIDFTFTMDEDEFFMMGDNSPRSKDSRLWNNTRRAKHRHAVPRSALVGEAFFIYWPHGIPFLNDGKGFAITNHKSFDGNKVETVDYPRFRLPFYPNVPRMKRIR